MAQNDYRGTLSVTVGNYLKNELKRRNITQETFAYTVGVSDRTMRRWVSGDINSLNAVEDIATALKVSVGDIFAECEDIPSAFKEVRRFLNGRKQTWLSK